MSSLGPLASTGALRQLVLLVHRQANVMAFGDVFLVLTVLFAALILAVPMMRRPGAPAGAGGGH